VLIIDDSRDLNLVSLTCGSISQRLSLATSAAGNGETHVHLQKCLESTNGALTALEFPQNKRTIVGSFDKIDCSFVISAWTDCRDLSEHGREGSNYVGICQPESLLSQGELLCSCKVGPHFQCSPLFSTSLPSLIYANLCTSWIDELTSFCCFSFCGPCCSASRAHSSFNIFQTADKESLDS